MTTPSRRGRRFLMLLAVVLTTLCLSLAPTAYAAKINGNGKANVLKGGPKKDTIKGKGGKDTISGGGGSDTIDAGSGSDFVNSGGGNDTVRGGSGGDELNGVGGNDRLYGDGGFDWLKGGAGNDRLEIAAEPSCPPGGSSSTSWRCKLDGGAGDDLLIDAAGADRLSGDEGSDTLYLADGADFAYGEEGSDTIYATNDGVRDEIYCGTRDDGENDTLVYQGSVDPLDYVLSCETDSVVPALPTP